MFRFFAGVAFYLVTGHELSHLEERFAIFLRQYFKTFLEELPDKVFMEQKEAAMKQKLKKPQKMEDITGLWVPGNNTLQLIF